MKLVPMGKCPKVEVLINAKKVKEKAQILN
jgi:hypothetical protein